MEKNLDKKIKQNQIQKLFCDEIFLKGNSRRLANLDRNLEGKKKSEGKTIKSQR